MAAKRDQDADVIASFNPATATPEDVERYIAARVAQIDQEIQPHLQAVEALQATRKRWVMITGGRSRFANEEEVAP